MAKKKLLFGRLLNGVVNWADSFWENVSCKWESCQAKWEG